MRTRLAALAVLSTALASATVAKAADDAVDGAAALVGTWIANLEKSQRHENHQFQNATMTFALDGEAITMTHGGVNAAGEKESGSVVFRADGTEHVVSEATPDVLVMVRWAGPRRLEISARKGETKVAGQSFEVSADGKTLTTSVWGTDASGRRFDQVIVFDRKMPDARP